MKRECPWLGFKPYKEKDADIFFGREQATADLFSMTEEKNVSVIYAVSGIGKSSLIDAGLIPLLRKHSYLPIHVRFDIAELKKGKKPDEIASIICKQLYDIFNDAIEKFKEDNKNLTIEWELPAEKDITVEGLWRALRVGPKIKATFNGEQLETVLKPFLIFDQFEQMLYDSNSQEVIETFFTLLKTLIQDISFPAEYSALRDGNLIGSDEARFKILISVRQEYIGTLDYWCMNRVPLPSIHDNRYCLQPLSDEDAKKVITPDGYDIFEDVVSEIIGIAKENDSVSSILLSVLCKSLYEQADETDGIKKKVTAEDVSKKKDSIIDTYYKQQVKASGVDEKLMHKLEEVLVDSDGKRVMVPVIKGKLHNIRFTEDTKRRLEDNGIILSETIGHNTFVELIHDRVAEAIHRNMLLTREKKQRTVVRRIIVGFFSLLLIAALLWSNYSVFPSSDPLQKSVIVPTTANTDPEKNIEADHLFYNSYFTKIKGLHNLKSATIGKNVRHLEISDCPNLVYVSFMGDSINTVSIAYTGISYLSLPVVKDTIANLSGDARINGKTVNRSDTIPHGYLLTNDTTLLKADKERYDQWKSSRRENTVCGVWSYGSDIWVDSICGENINITPAIILGVGKECSSIIVNPYQKIREIYLPIKKFNGKYPLIELSDSAKSTITLKVPAGCRNIYLENPDYRKFKAIEEASVFSDIRSRVAGSVAGVQGWFKAYIISYLGSFGTICIALLIFLGLIFLFAHRYYLNNRTPDVPEKTAKLRAFGNGLMTVLLLILVWMSVYWSIWWGLNYKDNIVISIIATVVAALVGAIYYIKNAIARLDKFILQHKRIIILCIFVALMLSVMIAATVSYYARKQEEKSKFINKNTTYIEFLYNNNKIEEATSIINDIRKNRYLSEDEKDEYFGCYFNTLTPQTSIPEDSKYIDVNNSFIAYEKNDSVYVINRKSNTVAYSVAKDYKDISSLRSILLSNGSFVSSNKNDSVFLHTPNGMKYYGNGSLGKNPSGTHFVVNNRKDSTMTLYSENGDVLLKSTGDAYLANELIRFDQRDGSLVYDIKNKKSYRYPKDYKVKISDELPISFIYNDRKAELINYHTGKKYDMVAEFNIDPKLISYVFLPGNLLIISKDTGIDVFLLETKPKQLSLPRNDGYYWCYSGFAKSNKKENVIYNSNTDTLTEIDSNYRIDSQEDRFIFASKVGGVGTYIFTADNPKVPYLYLPVDSYKISVIDDHHIIDEKNLKIYKIP